MNSMDAKDLHVFFLPFLAPGHMIPMIDMARLFSSHGVKSTIVTTTANSSLISPTLCRANANATLPINLLLLPFPSADVNLPSGHENLIYFPNPDVPEPFLAAIKLLETPFKLLLHEHQPDCIISDVFFTWSTTFGIPSILFHGSSFFTATVSGVVARLKLQESTSGYQEPFIVPGLPHRITLRKSLVPGMLLDESELRSQMGASARRSFGMIGNTFYELENDYVDLMKSWPSAIKFWNVGPVSLCNRDELDMAARGGGGMANSIEADECLVWLSKHRPNSVLYVSFGSMGRFTGAQLEEIAAGLEAAGHPFIWVVRDVGDEWMPNGFKERVLDEKRGLIMNGWAPQMLLLNRVEVGVEVGVRVCSSREEERVLVKREEIKKAVEELMGDGEEKERRRERAEELKKMAEKAVEVGGSSYEDLSRLIEELLELKKRGNGSEQGMNLTSPVELLHF
ncbi:hypothetical protein J5N97_019654 [Dioscorea zingiberensis]|uniref:Uncharacterized protein n=1 Tax=Dioscorea zingiberensis TaxID=325984 RepID=A0A9D5CGD9_9LILI|nr:hypothetical protein J5N97_019654 [Dioscorea zingiberensis]